jgi:hypothetical protein
MITFSTESTLTPCRGASLAADHKSVDTLSIEFRSLRGHDMPTVPQHRDAVRDIQRLFDGMGNEDDRVIVPPQFVRASRIRLWKIRFGGFSLCVGI